MNRDDDWNNELIDENLIDSVENRENDNGAKLFPGFHLTTLLDHL